jgi:hypothetical protein
MMIIRDGRPENQQVVERTGDLLPVGSPPSPEILAAVRARQIRLTLGRKRGNKYSYVYLRTHKNISPLA